MPWKNVYLFYLFLHVCIVVRMTQIWEKHMDPGYIIVPAGSQFKRNWWINRILDSDRFLTADYNLKICEQQMCFHR